MKKPGGQIPGFSYGSADDQRFSKSLRQVQQRTAI